MILRTAMYGNHTSDNNDRGNGTAILLMVWLAFSVFNLIITPLLRMAVSRNREYAADATGAHITRNPHALASALRKIPTDSRIESMDKIIFIDDGRIVAVGTHEELLNSCHAYKTMVELQRLDDQNTENAEGGNA